MRIFFLNIALFLSAAVCGQQQYSIHAGITSNTVNGEPVMIRYGTGPDYLRRSGFVIGVSLRTRLWKKLWYEAGLFYMSKNNRNVYELPGFYKGSIKEWFDYLVLSHNLLLELHVGKKTSFTAGAGFFTAIALGGRYRLSRFDYFSGGMGTESGNLEFGSNDGGYRRGDVGGNLLLRGQHKRLQLTAQFSTSFLAYNLPEKLRFNTLAVMLGYSIR